MFSSKPHDKVVLLLSIQSAIVRTTLVVMRPSLPPLIIYNENTEVPYQSNTSTSRLIKSTLKVVKESVDTATKYLHGLAHAQKKSHTEGQPLIPKHVSGVHYILSSPWIVSRAKTITQKFDKPIIANEDTVLGIVAKERSEGMTNANAEVEIIEEKIFDVSLNGYSVAQWSGRMAKDLTVSFALSVAGVRMIEKFREAVRHIVRGKYVYFHSSMLLQYVAMKAAAPDNHSYILIHAHGELTDLVIVDQGMATFFGSYPRGIDSILRSVANTLNITPSIADSLLSMYEDKQVDARQKKSAMIVDHLMDGWIGELNKLCHSSSYKKPVPKLAIISARSHENLFKKTYESSHPGSHVVLLSEIEHSNLVAYANALPPSPLVALYSIALGML